MTAPKDTSRATSRRTFLKGTAAVGGVAGLATTPRVGRAQETGGRATRLRFGGEVSGWQGRSPDEIEGETNPTLQLGAGEDYRFVWENTDGQPHNVVIIDSDGNELERTELISEEGATQALDFTATPEMDEYYCEAHPGSMRGGIEVTGDGDEDGEAADETTTPANETQSGGEETTTVETTTEGPQLPEDFESQLEFAGERFSETMSGSLDYSLFQSNLDTYQQQLSRVLDTPDLASDAESSFRQVGQTGIAIESTMDGAGLYQSIQQFFPDLTPEYVGKVAQRARDEQAVMDVLTTVSVGESPDTLLRAIEQRSESVASTLSPESPDFRPVEGAIHGGLLTLKDSGRLLRLREDIATDMQECIDATGQIGVGFLLVGRSIQNLLRSEGMSGQQAALGVLTGAAVMAIGNERLHRCLWTNAISVGTTATENNTTAGNQTTETVAGGNQTTTVGNQTNGTSNASSPAGLREETSSTVRGDLGVLGGCASLVGYLLSSEE